MKQELKHEPVSTRVKLKILPHLLRSRLAAECFPANIQVRSVMLLAMFSFLFSVKFVLVYPDNSDIWVFFRYCHAKQ